MSLRQLSERMKITPQSVKEIEEREKSASISLKVLRQAGDALEMKLVYGFIPRTKTLKKMVEERAVMLAKEIVMRTSKNMELEDQDVGSERLEQAIIEKAQDIQNKMPKYLWD